MVSRLDKNKENTYLTFSPTPVLQPYVDNYWLGINKNSQQYTILPDGAVDVVIQSNDSNLQSRVFGTTTKRTEIEIEPDNHYLGIRFKPGQSRHFVNLSAKELTDEVINAQDILDFSLEELSEELPKEGIAQRLNQLLEGRLKKQQPKTNQIDNVIALIENSQGMMRIEEAAMYSGKSRRQFERVFKETVGVSPKFFSIITRFNHTTTLITQLSQTKLADIAADAGYSDQSHMNHDFKRITGVSPNDFLRDFEMYLKHDKNSD